MRRIIRTLASAATVALLALASQASAQVTSVNGKIAFEVCDYNIPPGGITCDIWVMNADGSEQTNLTNTPELNERVPAWSPDGTRIAYVKGDTYFWKIMVMNADGTGQAPVVPTPNDQFGPTWSADGAQIAFSRAVPGEVISPQYDIFVINTDGTGETNLTNSDYDELSPAWSPDGTRIAFAGVRPEMMSGGELAAQWEIVTVNPDGSGELILTAGLPGTPRGDLLEEDTAPKWSPDSSMLVYMTQSVDPCCPPWQIEKVNRDGTGILLLSDNPLVDDMFPSFSPDGTLIIFVSDRDGDLAFYTMPAPVAAAPARPNAITPLPTPANASNPVWGRAPRSFFELALKVDAHGPGGSSDLNGILEPGESVIVEPFWRNILTAPVSFTGTAAAFTGPAGPAYTFDDTFADYGTAAGGASTDCYGAMPAHDCYRMTVDGARPATHWDATFDETLASGSPVQKKTWTLHVGGSFPDVTTSQQFYPFVENLLHNGITGGCGGGDFCPTAPVSRGQMAVFLLKSEHGSSYTPPGCFAIFSDVPCSNPFAVWIERLFQEGITGGCGGGAYCPDATVTRAQMAVFLMKAKGGPAYVPPACTGTMFLDVPCAGGVFDAWIEDLANHGITGGCGGGAYCPGNPNNRGQMAAFLVKTFGLQLYGP